ncbi:tRNA-splicing endonuclease subunit sen54 N-term-domain-containing protein [Pisolithus marmoratus]|nr:tRNA-splicing endonuclease subunit sen54 N-term-domain-containing protein [Pisolithus marmoratus]
MTNNRRVTRTVGWTGQNFREFSDLKIISCVSDKLHRKYASTRPVIPKRGEKDFEPAHGGGSGLQLHILDRARDAMFEVLRAERSISSKSVSYGIWYPSIARVHVVTSRGVHFASMGHSVSRTSGKPGNTEPELARNSKTAKRLELLPEEAIYLIERGALFCYKNIPDNSSPLNLTNVEVTSPGAPMTIQQAYAEMIGCEDITLECYQVYAYLKRLGFVLRRAKPPSDFPVAPSHSPRQPATRPASVWQRIATSFSNFARKVLSVVGLVFHRSPWRPLGLRGIKSNGDLLKSLRFLPCGHSTPLFNCSKPQHYHQAIPTPPSSSPYNVFFHVYKPSTPFRKTAPPPPDFYVVVIDARTAATPSLYELTALFEGLPEMPLPPPRKRRTQTAANAVVNTSPGPAAPSTSPLQTVIQRLLCYLRFKSHTSPAPSPDISRNPIPPKPNPFAHLKAGKKSVVIAAVDSGNISFFRFGEGAFHDWPMI